MKKNYIKYITAFTVIIAALIYFITSAMSGEIYYSEVSELLNKSALVENGRLRISGIVTPDNFSMNKFGRYASFEITDKTGAVLPVVYKGAIPDAFEIGASVVIEGSYNASDKVFLTKKLLAKCPSKYEAEGEKHPDVFPEK